MQRHAIDLKRAQLAGRHLFAANDPKAEQPRVDPKIVAADERALREQMQRQGKTS